MLAIIAILTLCHIQHALAYHQTNHKDSLISESMSNVCVSFESLQHTPQTLRHLFEHLICEQEQPNNTSLSNWVWSTGGYINGLTSESKITITAIIPTQLTKNFLEMVDNATKEPKLNPEIISKEITTVKMEELSKQRDVKFINICRNLHILPDYINNQYISLSETESITSQMKSFFQKCTKSICTSTNKQIQHLRYSNHEPLKQTFRIYDQTITCDGKDNVGYFIFYPNTTSQHYHQNYVLYKCSTCNLFYNKLNILKKLGWLINASAHLIDLPTYNDPIIVFKLNLTKYGCCHFQSVKQAFINILKLCIEDGIFYEDYGLDLRFNYLCDAQKCSRNSYFNLDILNTILITEETQLSAIQHIPITCSQYKKQNNTSAILQVFSEDLQTNRQLIEAVLNNRAQLLTQNIYNHHKITVSCIGAYTINIKIEGPNNNETLQTIKKSILNKQISKSEIDFANKYIQQQRSALSNVDLAIQAIYSHENNPSISNEIKQFSINDVPPLSKSEKQQIIQISGTDNIPVSAVVIEIDKQQVHKTMNIARPTLLSQLRSQDIFPYDSFILNADNKTYFCCIAQYCNNISPYIISALKLSGIANFHVCKIISVS